ncbi:MAG: aminotransferase class I/II-fold pyridoxal phosphate-dependent enzyme [Pseudomonadota bacterium]|nr:aminotransferase class I/II-fold pyridoxal phosphate-dependent enzyme [Pseudomonadota bacterium]
MNSLDQFCQGKLDDMEAKKLRRILVETDRHGPAKTRRTGKDMVSFSCNDYLDLSHHPKVLSAANSALYRYGAGSGASRLVTGNTPLYAKLEAKLANFKGSEDAIVFGSGYLTNLGAIPCLVGRDDLIIADELCHACLYAGAHLSRSTFKTFHHNDVNQLTAILEISRSQYPKCMILVDGVYSMDGDRAPVKEIASLAEKYDAWLLIDDAHGLGVVAEGKGSSYVDGNRIPVPLQMGTLSKAIGGYGGYLCASKPVIDFIKTRARSFIYTTGLPPATLAAAIASLELISTDKELVKKPMMHAKLFSNTLGLSEPESCIVPVILGSAEKALEASSALENEGYIVTPIRPPTVAEGTSRLRITFTAEHKEADVRQLANLLRPFLPEKPINPFKVSS